MQGIETNREYVQQILLSDVFEGGEMHTRYLDGFRYQARTIEVVHPGTMTTIQDYPGRTGYWDVGVPPSGPFNSYAFRLGNRLLGNPADSAGLEITLNGPTLQFNVATRFVLAGARFEAQLNGETIDAWQVCCVESGDKLKIGKVIGGGARAYLLVAGGFDGNDYLGSRSTFTLGQFGGFSGRALRSGDVLHLQEEEPTAAINHCDSGILPDYGSTWELRVIAGPQGAPDYFTTENIDTFFASEWEVHYNSSRTGIRLIGPKPEWARSTGGEAGMHPSNIHDNAYALGTIDFTGDMPVILGPDGPSPGGFVCPATVIAADLWKLGQLKAGDKLRFVPVSQSRARELELRQLHQLESLQAQPELAAGSNAPLNPIVAAFNAASDGEQVVYRAAGDKYLLVEYGPMELDVRLRFRVYALMLHLRELAHPAILELTPGIRSLQIHFDSLRMTQEELVSLLTEAEQGLQKLRR